MEQSGNPPKLEERIRELTASLDKYVTETADVTPAAAADLTKAVHELAEHILDLHRRMEKIEATLPDWTTKGWTPPPGG